MFTTGEWSKVLRTSVISGGSWKGWARRGKELGEGKRQGGRGMREGWLVVLGGEEPEEAGEFDMREAMALCMGSGAGWRGVCFTWMLT